MRLFYGAASPFARIVRIALLETGLDPQVRKQEVTLRDPTSALLPYNPVGRVPTLELDDGTILTESLLILNYIDTLHLGRPLLPSDGSDRWRTLAEMGTAAGMFTGMGVDGIGWGTGVALDKVWVTSFNGKIGVMDFNGNPIGQESDFPTAGKNGGLQGVGIAPNGDVWIADAVKDQLLYFPGGRVKDGKDVPVKGLVSPFSIVIDAQNRVWVGNALSNTIVRFPAEEPSKAEAINAGGVSVRGIALDSKGNVWTASLMNLDFPLPVIPHGSEIMTQFQIAGLDIFGYTTPLKPTGVIQVTRPDGSHLAPNGFSGLPINVPWGLSIDGRDDVWFGNFFGRGVILMAGENTTGHPAGTKAGDVIHQFQSASIQMITEVAVDPAGNVWVANNWNDKDAVMAYDPARPISTWGGGSGITVIYGVAGPVKTPLIGTVRQP